VRDLEPLRELSVLQSLDLSNCDQVSNLGPLRGLSGLQSLRLINCDQVSDLEPLRGLSALQSLYLWSVNDGIQIEDLDRWPALETLVCDRLPGVPREVLSEGVPDSCLERLKAWMADLAEGEEEDARFKLFLLGNGGAGKTQLRRFLRGQPMDDTIPSTHGVEVESFPLKLSEHQTVEVNLWDFGGQDIYLGTHSLFLEGRSVVALLWKPDLETRGDYEENGVPLRAQPLPYWAHYIESLTGHDNPVLVIQSQCRRQMERLRPSHDFAPFALAPESAFCRDPDLGHEALWANLKDAVRYLFETQGVYRIGRCRRQVRTDLEQLRDRDGVKSISYAEFDQRCHESGGISSTEAFLNYLHRTGSVFYREGLFGGDIVLDQGWALGAIYALFDRKQFLPLYQNFGRFTPAQLAAVVWRDHTPGERELFLGMMKQCGICFANHPEKKRSVDGEETEFIAPDLLPDRPTAVDAFLHRQPEGATPLRLEFAYAFLHDGTFRQFMCEVGREVGDAGHYWRHEFHLYELRHEAEAHVSRRVDPDRPGAGTIVIEAWGREPRPLLEALMKTLLGIRIGQEPVVMGDLDGKAPTRVPGSGLPDEDGDGPAGAPKTPLKGLDFGPLPIDRPTEGGPKIFVSYAWGEETADREKIVNELCDRAKSVGREVIRDKTHMGYGNLISDFMKQIGAGQCVIVVISDKYLRSTYCMNELHQIYQRCAGNKEEFLERIIPLVLDDVKIGTLEEQKVYRDHWKTTHESQQEIIKECVDEIGPEHLTECQLMGQFSKEVLKILKFVQDQLMPRGVKAIRENEFQAVIERLP
jgi:internalin A